MKRILATAAATVAMTITGFAAPPVDVGTTVSVAKTPGVSFVERHGGVKEVVLEAGTDPSTLELRFPGAQKVTFENVGTLLVINHDGSLWRYKPEVYQVVNGKRKPVLFGFHFVGNDRVSLKVQKLNPSAPLVVGPVKGESGNS